MCGVIRSPETVASSELPSHYEWEYICIMQIPTTEFLDYHKYVLPLDQIKFCIVL